MSLSVQIETVKSAEPQMAAIAARVTPAALAAEVGPRAVRLMQRNFRSLGANKKGWPSTSFWGRAAEATFWAAENGLIFVDCNQIGVRQRYLGGPILPKPGHALTIPAAAEAYGKTAGEFSNLIMRMVLNPETGRMGMALVEKSGTVTGQKSRKQKSGAIKVTITSQASGLVPMFWLSKGVRQKPNPAVLPNDQQWDEALTQSAKALVKTLTN